jgi:hypothetical protein
MSLEALIARLSAPIAIDWGDYEEASGVPSPM